MPLEDPNVIDAVSRPAPGKLVLIIRDTGVTTEPARRRELLVAKLLCYARYALGEQFAQDHPGVGPDDVSIGVLCSTPPTDEMLQITHLRPRVEPPRLFRVRYAVDDGKTITPVSAPPVTPPDRGKIRPRLVTQEFLAKAPRGTHLPRRPLGATGLSVAYVEDGEDNVTFIMGKAFDALDLTEQQLYELALENLARTMTMRQTVRDALEKHVLASVKCLDSYDATRLLLVPQHLQPGEALIALVPDRDTLTLAQVPAGNKHALDMIADLAKVPDSDCLLLDRPLRVTHAGFEVM